MHCGRCEGHRGEKRCQSGRWGEIDEDELRLDIKWELEEDEHQEAVESGDEENVIQHVGINVQVMKWQ